MTATLTEDQRQLRDQVVAAGAPASTTLLAKRDDGVPARDVAAVAEHLCPGAGRDYLR